ncbi:hypothetical protein ACMHYJ_02850 [Castellaniella hirudinis]|uniref:hypothetical protein n=1 Tax=Castellaniella hirudinis TaxID=1144617 RepID=UPI0039C4BCF4
MWFSLVVSPVNRRGWQPGIVDSHCDEFMSGLTIPVGQAWFLFNLCGFFRLLAYFYHRCPFEFTRRPRRSKP